METVEFEERPNSVFSVPQRSFTSRFFFLEKVLMGVGEVANVVAECQELIEVREGIDDDAAVQNLSIV